MLICIRICSCQFKLSVIHAFVGRKTVAFYDERNIFSSLPSTIRHSDCWVLSQSDRCLKCEEFRLAIVRVFTLTKTSVNFPMYKIRHT